MNESSSTTLRFFHFEAIHIFFSLKNQNVSRNRQSEKFPVIKFERNLLIFFLIHFSLVFLFYQFFV
mgnify:CR=1 FL=1